MSVLKGQASHKIDMGFVLAIITLFAATSLALVLIGAKQYKYINNTIDTNHDNRVVSSYLTEKIRQGDSDNNISICELKGVPALAIETAEENVTYTTYIYCYENYLCELVVTKNSVFELSSGQKILELKDLKLTFANDSLIQAEITNTNGDKQTLFFNLHCSVGKEQL